MLKRISLTSGLLLAAVVSYGQYAQDAFRYSDQVIGGTARFQGLGGNHTALGGDASNLTGNPAGLGFYNRSEFSLSPGLNLLNGSSQYIDRTSSVQQSYPNLTQASVIFAGQRANNENTGLRRFNFGIGYSRQLSLNNQSVLSGLNNRSSIAEAYLQDVNGLNIPAGELNNQFNSNTNVATSLLGAAYQLYLINPTEENGTRYFRYDPSVPVEQQVAYRSTGAVTQWTAAAAGNFGDKLYVGGSLGFSRTRFEYTESISEQYAGGRVFRGVQQNSDYTVTGNGINLSVGAMYRASQFFQLGATLVTPTWTTRQFEEEFNQSVSIDPIGIPTGNGGTFVPDVRTVPVAPNNFSFNVATPLRASGGATFFFGRNGFLTATAEYVGYAGMRVGTQFYQSASDNQAFRQDFTNEVANTFQNVVNFRAGAEFRAGLFRVRGGAAYLPDPYKQRVDGLDRTRIVYTGGFGVRNDRFFADVSGAFYTAKSAYTPYTLPNPQDFASGLITNKITTLTLSAGVFF